MSTNLVTRCWNPIETNIFANGIIRVTLDYFMNDNDIHHYKTKCMSEATIYQNEIGHNHANSSENVIFNQEH